MEKSSKKILISKFILTGLSILMLILSCVYLNAVPRYILLISIIIFSSLSIIIPSLDIKKHETLYKSLVISVVLLFTLLISYIILDKTNLLAKFTDAESLLTVIRETSYWGVIIYILVVIFQVIVLPIPAAIPAFIGGKLYGPLFAFIYMSIGTIIGSIMTFALGKVFGRKLVTWVIGAEKTERYADLLNEKGKIVFIAMMLFPFFPDDIICLVAGMTSMTYKFFTISILITRPIVIAVTCFFLEGTIIPFSGWGIPVWIALFAICIVLLIISKKLKNKFMKSKPSDLVVEVKANKRKKKNSAKNI